MAKAIITFKLMPEGVEVDLNPIREQALEIARAAGAIGEMQSKEDPIAFGLKAVLVLAIANVQSAEVAKMDLALG